MSGASATAILDRFLDHAEVGNYAAKERGSVVLHSELQVRGVVTSRSARKYAIEGRIDQIRRCEGSQGYEIYELKTSATLPGQASLERNVQLCLYCWCCVAGDVFVDGNWISGREALPGVLRHCVCYKLSNLIPYKRSGRRPDGVVIGMESGPTSAGTCAGISPRWANYLLCMVCKAEKFGIDQETMADLDISKGLEIFRLNDAEQVKELLNRTIRRGMPLKELKREVAAALGLAPEDEPQTVRKVWYFSESQWSVINQAIQVVHLTAGSESDTYAIELIAADYLAGIGVQQAG